LILNKKIKIKTGLTSWTGKIDIILLYNIDFKEVKPMDFEGTEQVITKINYNSQSVMLNNNDIESEIK
jgi:hypothetical protein